MQAKTCPKCTAYGTNRIFTVDIDPKTHKKWKVERCQCGFAFDLEPYVTKSPEKRDDDGRRVWPVDDKWKFGL